MPTSQMSQVIQQLQTAALAQDAQGMTDGELLERFVSRHDEAAFAGIVRRHGAMVWGVCRRTLSSYHDAEDAFQATFLVLVRKAASIVPREMVANFLYGVAHQTALKARANGSTRKARERQVAEMPEAKTAPPSPWRDLEPLLDEELSRLPDKYRLPLILCDLEGKTRAEAAQQLGWPEGTVAGRVARARTMLAKRLARHALALPAGGLAAALAQNAATASAPGALVSATIKTSITLAASDAAVAGVTSAKIAALTNGVLKMMLLAKLKTATVLTAVLLTIGGSGVGIGIVAYPSLAADATNAGAPTLAAPVEGPPETHTVPKTAEKQSAPPVVGPVQETKTTPPTAAIKEEPAQDLTKPDPVDFGKLSRGKVVERKITLRNGAHGPVKITSMRVSCGCVKVHASKNSLRPNEKTELIVSVDTNRFTGKKTVTIYISTEDRKGVSREIRVWVQAESEEKATPPVISPSP